MSFTTHDVQFQVWQTWGRINALASEYYDIAESSYEHFLYTKGAGVELLAMVMKD